jgi:hypothetical protein
MRQLSAAPRIQDGASLPAFVDVDRDGWLDLFVGQYLNYSIAGNVVCYSRLGSARLLSAERVSRPAEPSVSQQS